MEVHPLLTGLLARMRAQEGPKLWQMPVAQARGLFKLTMTITDDQTLPIGKVEDIAIAGTAGMIPARIYTPHTGPRDGRLPAILFYHGGGFVLGDLDTHDPLCRRLATESRCKVVSVDYRLAPEHPFPAAVEDAFAALEWISAEALDYGIEPGRLAVAGDSAGGNLAAVVCHLAKQRGDPPIAFQLLIYPTTQAHAITGSMKKFAKGYFLESDAINWLMDQYVRLEEQLRDPRLSPLLSKDFSRLPPALIITAGFDPLKDEGEAYAVRLRAAGVPVDLKNYPDMVHGFFNMTAIVSEAREAINEAAVAVAHALAKYP